MKVLVVGPSPTKSKGGMATVIEEIAKDKRLNGKFDIDIYESYFRIYASISQNVIMIFTIFMQLRMVAHSEKGGMSVRRKSGGKK